MQMFSKMTGSFKAIKFVVCSIFVLVTNGIWVSCSSASPSGNITNDVVNNEPEEIVEVDTVQVYIDLRKDSVFNGNIFAGLKFGLDKHEYDRIINVFKKENDGRLYFLNQNGETDFYTISSVSPKFYKNKLYEIEVKIDDYQAYWKLETVFENKYGRTKNKLWEWKNLKIELNSHSRRPFDPNADRGYGSSFNGWYYESPGSRNLTRSPGWTTITYADLDLYELQHKEQLRVDSIKAAKQKHAEEQKAKIDLERAMNYKDNI